MVEVELTLQRIKMAETLIRKLDNSKIPPHSAFWYYFTETSEWKLVIAMKEVGTTGPKKIYHKIQMMLNYGKLGFETIELDDITLVKPDAPIVVLLRKIVRTGPVITGIRITHNFVNGKMIEDAYIYRLG